MKNHIIKFSVLVVVILLNTCKTKASSTKTSDTNIEEHLYLGQKPPGITPKPFAPGLVTTEGWEYSGVFSPNMKEFYFLRQVGETNREQEFVVYKNEGSIWRSRPLYITF